MTVKLEELTLLNIMRNGKLLPLQFAILKKLQRNRYAFVLDEVGCGKTIEAGICIWDTIVNEGKNILIVAPSNLTFNWYSEMLTKFGLDFQIVGGTQDSIDLYYDNYQNDIEEGVLNLCIASYDSRYGDKSNAALDRIRKKNINWDLIVLDEGHESKNSASRRYQTLGKYKSKKVLFLSATPIKNLQEDFFNEFNLVKELLKDNDELNLEIDPQKAISFDLTYPISRNFKEIITNSGKFKQRVVAEIDYDISDEIVEKLPCDGLAFDQKRNCIMLFENYLRNSFTEVFSIYHKRSFSSKDITTLRDFDRKLDSLLNKIKEIIPDIKNEQSDRVVIFCNHIEVVDYLKKALAALYGCEFIEAMHGENYEQEERKKRLLLLDKADSEMDKKRIVVLSHNIASVGVNLSKFTHLINYELPYTPADLEQRFGRIDRLTNDSDELMLYFFKDKNGCFDTVYLNRIFTKLTWEVMPMLPGKNLLTTVTPALINRYYEVFQQLLAVERYLLEIKEGSNTKNEGLLMLVREGFGKNIFEAGTGKIIESNLLEILEIINNTKIQWNISDDMSELQYSIEEHLNNMNNKVFYKHKGNEIGIGYDELYKQVYSDEYNKFKEHIEEVGKRIIENAQAAAKRYQKDKDDIMNEVRTYLNGKDDIAFSVLYGFYSALKQEGVNVNFKDIIREYNGAL